jgi:hypothetical protein
MKHGLAEELARSGGRATLRADGACGLYHVRRYGL